MGEKGSDIASDRPTHWFVIFDEHSDVWWVRWLAVGRYKHVRACGQVPGSLIWLFLDYRLSGLAVHAALGAAADRLLERWMGEGDCIHIAQGDAAPFFFPMMSCVTAVRHLIGARSGALRPDRLWSDLIAQGGKVLHGQQERATGPADGHEPARSGQEAGAG